MRTKNKRNDGKKEHGFSLSVKWFSRTNNEKGAANSKESVLKRILIAVIAGVIVAIISHFFLG